MNPTPPQAAGYLGGFSLQSVGSADDILKALHLRLKRRGITGGKIKNSSFAKASEGKQILNIKCRK